MKFKNLVLTVAVLAVLSAIAWYFQRPPPAPPPDPRVGQSVFDPKALDRTTQIRISDQGKSVRLTKNAEGTWIDNSYYDLPVDFAKLGRFVDDLTGAKVQRFVSRNPEVLARLEFKNTAIALLDAAGKEVWKLTLGKDSENGGRFVKFGDEAKAYVATIAVFIDAEAKNWADSQLVDLKADDIAAVDVGFEHSPSVLATRAKKDEPWAASRIPAGQRLKADSITSLLSTLTTLRFEDTSDPTDPRAVAAREHSRTIKLTTFAGATLTVTLGRKPEEKKVEAAKPEAGNQKPAVAGLKSQASGQKPEIETQPAIQGSEPKTQNPKLKTQNLQAKPEAPNVTTIPAGPVYAFIASSDPAAAINAMMKKRAFQVYDWNFTGLPQKPADLFEPIPAPPMAEKKPEVQPAKGSAEAKPAEPAPEAAKPEAPEVKPAETKAASESSPEAKPASTSKP